MVRETPGKSDRGFVDHNIIPPLMPKFLVNSAFFPWAALKNPGCLMGKSLPSHYLRLLRCFLEASGNRELNFSIMALLFPRFVSGSHELCSGPNPFQLIRYSRFLPRCRQSRMSSTSHSSSSSIIIGGGLACWRLSIV